VAIQKLVAIEELRIMGHSAKADIYFD